MTPRNNAAVSGWSRLDAPKPLASWYTEGVCDGVGDRLWMFDNSGTPSLELLRFHPLLATANGFEDALRERVDELDGFDHPSFSRVRAIQRMDSGDLALVSTFTAGKRVSEILNSPNAQAGVHPAFAAWFIRELTSAVAELHRQGRGIAHAGLTTDRVILTPDSRLVIVEHVLGAALDRLQLPVSRLWQDLGLVAAENAGRAQLDQRTDVIQVAWIALSLLLGRRITPLEYPQRIDTLLDEFVAASRDRSPVLVSALRRWLERALHSTGDAFESAIHAHAGLGDLRGQGSSRTVSFPASRLPAELALEAPPQLQLQPMPATSPHSAAESAETPTMAMATDFAFDELDDAAPEKVSRIADAAPRQARPPLTGWIVAAVFALVAVAEAGWIGRIELTRAAVSPTPPLPVVVESLQGGDTVIVDGREIGVTPLTVALTPGMRSIRVRTRPTVDQTVAAPEAPAVVRAADTGAAAALSLAASRERRGGLRLSSPIELQVLEGERVLGSSADGPVVATAGRHELDFVNSAFGYRSHQVVDIKSGQIVPMKISPPDGRVSVNAVPWAQVSINGKPVGDTPLGNLPLPVGEHEITFRHPQLGEQTQKVIVKSGVLTRVSASMAR
jgi:serine/threonine-protein kinase